MFRKLVLAGIVAASCVLVGSPASAAPAIPCADLQESNGVSVKCDYGSYEVTITCTMLGPLVGSKDFHSPKRNDGQWTKATCGTGYYFQVGRGDLVYPTWDPRG
ncbi:hypothetical protein [Allokutzneria sp. NRRL B-24872]|uniref:hypothetical protein n=1 Tax=Allokutzneria sp. NRRL B-24872 TaxID=1137961 RepID=UPI000A361E82|nr:hypothetical protein [Allokutzneria sp. NRRL B-24872]